MVRVEEPNRRCTLSRTTRVGFVRQSPARESSRSRLWASTCSRPLTEDIEGACLNGRLAVAPVTGSDGTVYVPWFGSISRETPVAMKDVGHLVSQYQKCNPCET